ncbi:hydrogenase expression/formation protein HypE [Acetobacteraceae bacterium]|nr:hydrogenase expression/formation protein HypE [Acetobacteraceae bacterium]
MMKKEKVITMAHGSGGAAMGQLLEELFLPSFSNPKLDQREDQARLPIAELSKSGDRLAFTTDSYVIDPITFPGGDIGKLAVCGTANDLSVGGAVPRFLSCGFILEEGLPFSVLKQIVTSMAETAKKAGIEIVTGDTKVVQKGAADKIFINTAGIGVIPNALDWSADKIQKGDFLIVSGTLGDHGATILNLRENLGMSLAVTSDCAVLEPLIAALRDIKGIRAMRDATRGGVNAILHEFAKASKQGIEVEENLLPVKAPVRGICELLGLDPINFANEGKVVLAVSPEAKEEVLSALKAHPLGKDSAIIGQVTGEGSVRLKGAYGVTRILDLPHAEPLPRIC